MEQRLRALLSLPAVVTQAPPVAADPAHAADPLDLAAFYAACNGLTLRDGTTLLGRDEAAKATAWLIEEKSLHWSDELLLLGERDDLVIVRDADRQGARAGGGVLEAPTDGLSSFKRVSLDLASYLELRAGVQGATPAPELAAKEAMAAGDAAALSLALAATFYPGAERDQAHAAQRLAVLLIQAGDEAGALAAFARAVDLRVLAAPRGAGEVERAAAWKAAAMSAEKAGAAAIAAACKSRAAGG